MKARTALVLVVIGLCFDAVAVVFKFEHWQYSGIFFLGSQLPKFLGLAVLGYKALRYPGFKDFLDRCNRVGGPAAVKRRGAPLTPLYVRVAYTAVR